MPSIFEFDSPLLASSIVLIAMGCISAFLSLKLHLKLRGIRIASKSLSAEVFNRTFNVFDPYPEQRKMIQGNTELVVFLGVYGSFILISIFVAKMLEFGLILGFITFIACLGLLMVDDVLEIRKNANTFESAFKKRTSLAKGDIEVLHLLKSVMPKMSTYYLLLAIVFFASSLSIPFLVSAFSMAFSQLGSMLIALNNALAFAPHIGILLSTILLAATAVTFQYTAARVKNKMFGLPSLERIDSEGEQFFRMKMFVRIMHHHPLLHVPEPQGPKKAEEKDVEPSEEQKQS
jgi:hypothetical protein